VTARKPHGVLPQENGIIKVEGEALTFLQPYTFASPTVAAQLLCAGSVPGPLHWKRVGDYKPLRNIKASA